MYVCICSAVTVEQLQQCASKGNTWREIVQSTGVAKDCGSCAKPALKVVRETQAKLNERACTMESSAEQSAAIYIAIIDVEHYCGKRRTKTLSGVSRRHMRAIAAFKKAVRALLAEHQLAADVVRYEATFKSLASVSLTCTAAVAKLLAGMDGLHAFFGNDGRSVIADVDE